jgi:hypothetical protein
MTAERRRPAEAVFSTTTETAAAKTIAAVFSAFPGTVIDGGEIVLLAIKPSLWRPVFASAPWLVASMLLALVLSGTGRPIPGLSLLATTQVVLLIGLCRLAWAVAQWLPRWHVLTNRRIIDIRGARTPVVTSLPLIHVRNTYVRRPWAESMAGVGTILFVAGRPNDNPISHSWRTIRDADEVHAKIRRAIEHAIDSTGLS